MAKTKPEVSIRSFGIYDHWDPDSKELPNVIEFTTKIPARVDIEFGMVVRIQKAKNHSVDFCIDHPGILDANGKRREPFEGSVYAKTNDWDFFLGDTIWEPIADKLGIWTLSIAIGGNELAKKAFEIVPDVN
ncbi:MAG: DUF3859 domain-containing protein [Planctomycetota bacterium]